MCPEFPVLDAHKEGRIGKVTREASPRLDGGASRAYLLPLGLTPPMSPNHSQDGGKVAHDKLQCLCAGAIK